MQFRYSDALFTCDRIKQVSLPILLKDTWVSQLSCRHSDRAVFRSFEREVSTFPVFLRFKDLFYFTGAPSLPILSEVDRRKQDPLRSVLRP